MDKLIWAGVFCWCPNSVGVFLNPSNVVCSEAILVYQSASKFREVAPLRSGRAERLNVRRAQPTGGGGRADGAGGGFLVGAAIELPDPACEGAGGGPARFLRLW